ncbi:lysozyme inhibitor LprI family protein [Vibrio sp. E150_011]
MTELIEKIGFIALGVLISGAAYLIKRKIESKPEVEQLDKHQKVLDIHRKMSEQKLDIASLNAFAQLLTAKNDSVQNHVQVLHSDSVAHLTNVRGEHLTQIEMNQLALESYSRAVDKLNAVFGVLKSKIDSDRIQFYEKSQIDWEAYSEAQARAVASFYQGGSIYPLIYQSELETLIHERIAHLQSDLDELIALGN